MAIGIQKQLRSPKAPKREPFSWILLSCICDSFVPKSRLVMVVCCTVLHLFVLEFLIPTSFVVGSRVKNKINLIFHDSNHRSYWTSGSLRGQARKVLDPQPGPWDNWEKSPQLTKIHLKMLAKAETFIEHVFFAQTNSAGFTQMGRDACPTLRQTQALFA